jgi:hypothetical protein
MLKQKKQLISELPFKTNFTPYENVVKYSN